MKENKIFAISTVDETKNKLKKPSNFLLELSNLMNNVEFRSFFDSYFENWDDIKTVIMFMKTYEMIDNEYYRKFGCKIEPSKMSKILKEMMSKSDYRSMIVNKMVYFMNDAKTIQNKLVISNEEFMKFCPNLIEYNKN